MSLAYAGFTPSQLAAMYGDIVNRGATPENMPPDDWARMRAQQQADANEIRRNRVRVKPKGQPTPKAPPSTSRLAGYHPKNFLNPQGLGSSAIGKIAASPVARIGGGIGLALYPSELGSGTLDSPEARRAMQQNALKAMQMPDMAWAAPGSPGSDVPLLVQSGLPPAERAAEIERQAAEIERQAAAGRKQQVIPAAIPAPATSIGGGFDMPERIARSQPGWAKQQAMAGTLRDLREEGFAPVSGLPGGIDPRSGNPWLGPNQIMVREGSAGPEAYQAAMDARGDAVQRGQDAGFERSQGYGGYLPNLPTRQALQEGGPITEYVVPGKGTATFMGKRQGGGTLSVIGGRTPEEQAIIDQRVAGIDRQTAAMRGLRNAEREAMGLAPLPDQQQLADQDLIDSIMIQYGQNPAIALEILKQARATRATTEQAGLQAAWEARQAQRAAEQDQQRWEAGFNFNRTKAQVEAMEKDRQYLMDVLKATPVLDVKTMLDIREKFMRETPTGGEVFDEQEFRGALGVEPFTGNTQPRAGKVYYKEDEDSYMLATPEGLVEIGGPDEVFQYLHNKTQQQQRAALLGR